jgi:hypothetical protein
VLHYIINKKNIDLQKFNSILGDVHSLSLYDQKYVILPIHIEQLIPNCIFKVQENRKKLKHEQWILASENSSELQCSKARNAVLLTYRRAERMTLTFRGLEAWN